MANQLLKKIVITGKIKAVTGLMVGASQNGMTIGGTNREVIRDPITREPYLPGSSLKGKMRSLVELLNGEFGPAINASKEPIAAGPSTNPDHLSAQLFGYIPKDDPDKSEKLNPNDRPYQRPSRLIVRDARLTPDSITDLGRTELLFTEVKTENAINRITSQATPRNFERVPAGAVFKLGMVLNVFEGDDEAELLRTLGQALRLVQDDYVGGGGSRGNGQISISLDTCVERNAAYYRTNAGETDRTAELAALLRYDGQKG